MGRHAIPDPDETAVFEPIRDPPVAVFNGAQPATTAEHDVDSYITARTRQRPQGMRVPKLPPINYEEPFIVIEEPPAPEPVAEEPEDLGPEATDRISRARLRQAAAQLREDGKIPVVRVMGDQPDLPPSPAEDGPVAVTPLKQSEVKPTQVAHPNQASLRSFIQTALALLISFAAIWPLLNPLLEDFFTNAGLPTPGYYVAALGVISAVAAALTRVMAIPAVNAWLTKIRLGANPK